MWTHSAWASDDKWHTVYYNGFLPISTWRQVAMHLGIDSIAEYIEFLKQSYPSVRFRSIPSINGYFMGLSIDFSDEQDAQRLAEHCNTVNKKLEV